MGITYPDAKMLWDARLRGACFTDTITLGHLSLYLHPPDVAVLRRAYQATFSQSTVTPLDNYRFGDDSDEFLRGFLGVTALAILDYSSYEGANTVHDLNQPIPQNLCGRFDAVIDGGTLEHVFNFPVAIANVMKMLRVGGTAFVTTPANNLCGHGFYQFSPELMFRVFTRENGFTLRRVTLVQAAYPSVERTPNRSVYEVTDPENARSRVGLVSRRPVIMMMEATKTDDRPLFTSPPLQSDYATRWEQGKTQSSQTRIRRMLGSLVNRLPAFLRARIMGYREMRRYSFSNRRFYRRLHW